MNGNPQLQEQIDKIMWQLFGPLIVLAVALLCMAIAVFVIVMLLKLLFKWLSGEFGSESKSNETIGRNIHQHCDEIEQVQTQRRRKNEPKIFSKNQRIRFQQETVNQQKMRTKEKACEEVIPSVFCPPVLQVERQRETYQRSQENYKVRRRGLLTKTEQVFFAALLDAVDGRFHIFVCVRIADLLEPTAKKFQKGSGWQTQFNRIANKHVDFVLSKKNDCSPVLVIELDDPSHEREERIERDRFVDSAFADAGLPLLHIKTDYSYLQHELRERIKRGLAGSEI